MPMIACLSSLTLVHIYGAGTVEKAGYPPIVRTILAVMCARRTSIDHRFFSGRNEHSNKTEQCLTWPKSL